MGSSTNVILNVDKLVTDISEQKIFFGEYSGFQRYDQYKYPFAKKIEEKQRNAFWNPNEISLVSDRLQFPGLPQHIQQIFTANILYQTTMDSANNSGLDSVLSEVTTSPEFEALYKTQAYFELIHSLSYSHILREVYPNATEVFDSVDQYPEIKQRLNKEISSYSDVKCAIHEFKSNGLIGNELVDAKHNLLDLILRIYALEGLKFYVSFLVTYIINNSYGGKIQGITRILKLINFDEDIHVSIMAGTLNILKKNKNEGFSEIIESDWFHQKATQIFQEVVDDEVQWGKYLMSFGDIPSLTPLVLDLFVKYYADDRLSKIGVKKVFNVAKSDTVVFYEQYKNIDIDNTAQQEAESTAYQVGILTDDIPDGLLDIKF